jgi:hypothetical protein
MSITGKCIWANKKSAVGFRPIADFAIIYGCGGRGGGGGCGGKWIRMCARRWCLTGRWCLLNRGLGGGGGGLWNDADSTTGLIGSALAKSTLQMISVAITKIFTNFMLTGLC